MDTTSAGHSSDMGMERRGSVKWPPRRNCFAPCLQSSRKLDMEIMNGISSAMSNPMGTLQTGMDEFQKMANNVPNMNPDSLHSINKEDLPPGSIVLDAEGHIKSGDPKTLMKQLMIMGMMKESENTSQRDSGVRF